MFFYTVLSSCLKNIGDFLFHLRSFTRGGDRPGARGVTATVEIHLPDLWATSAEQKGCTRGISESLPLREPAVSLAVGQERMGKAMWQ